jgi:extradiol dioxygenase family protein
MKKSIFLLFVIFSTSQFFGQDMTGSQLLEKAIEYHDPQWKLVNIFRNFQCNDENPTKSDRHSIISLDLPNEYFQLHAYQDNISYEYTLETQKCNINFNGNIATDKEKTANKLSCERAKMYQNYYTYLYGLPMKLKDAGTIIHEKVALKKFKEKNYLVLKVSYEKEVGEDTWYFYFDPSTYAMEVYQFYHEEEKNDGEFILLSGLETVNGIKMPKKRAWYYNKGEKYLGTDILTVGQRYD